MGTRLINSKILSLKKQFLCNPYKQVTLWLFVILNYICIYGYKHIYTRLTIFPFKFLISKKKNFNFLWNILLTLHKIYLGVYDC